MSEIEIKSIEEVRTIVEEKVYKLLPNLINEIKDEIVEDLIETFEKIDSPEKEAEYKILDKDLISQQFFAVHNKDLLALDGIGKFEVIAEVVPEAIKVIVGETGGQAVKVLLLFWFNIRRKRIKISEKQALVLKALKKYKDEGMGIDLINAQLDIKPWIHKEEILGLLESLKNVEKEDGSKTDLVKEEDGKWVVVDV